jgi:chromosomal replication initiation ATPase DnaA
VASVALQRRGPEHPSIEAIQQAVAAAFRISVKDLVGGRPKLQINNYPDDVRVARKAALYLCCKLTEDKCGVHS